MLQQSQSGLMKYPGDQCNQTEQCYRGTCIPSDKNPGLSICVVSTPINGTCTWHIDCPPGLFCSLPNPLVDGTCQQQIKIGMNCSSQSEICENNAMCMGGVCTRKRSLNVTDVVENLQQAELCYTNFVKKDGKGVIKCARGWFLDSSHARRPTDSQDCNYYRIGALSP